jgi:hypothetical protein
MKLFTVICILLAFCIVVSCGDDPVELKKKMPPSYTGTFLIDTTMVANSCNFPVTPDTIENVTVRNDTIIFAGFYGTWDPSTLRGVGTTGPVTVPIIVPSCNGYYTLTFDITFTHVDSFTGTWHVDYTYDFGCPDNTPCSYDCDLAGVRY